MVKDASKGKTQKLIIPRGTIDSADTTIIEIPVKLHRQPVVVAKKRPTDLDESEYSYDTRNRDGISFVSPQPVVQFPDSYSEFMDKSRHNSSVKMDDTRGASMQRANYPGDIHQRPSLPSNNDRYAVPPPRPYGSSPGDMYQQSLPRFDRGPFPNDYFPSGPQPSDINDVEEIEKAEKQVILEELQKYHEARRRFLEDASAIATKSKMRVSRQADRPEPFCRNYECPQRDATGSCTRKPSMKLSGQHCTFASQTSSSESFGGCRSENKYSSSCQTEVPVKKVYPIKPTVYHTSSMDCRACCSLTEKASASEEQRNRTSMFSTQELCEIATQFREARKKLDKVIAQAAQASQPAEGSSGVSLAPCQKYNRNQSPGPLDSRSCSNAPIQSNPRELDPLLVSRHLQTEARERPVEKKISAREDVRYREEQEAARPRKDKVGIVSSGVVLLSPSPLPTQTQSSGSSKKVDTLDSYGKFMNSLQKDDGSQSHPLNNSTFTEKSSKSSGTRPDSKADGAEIQLGSLVGGNSTYGSSLQLSKKNVPVSVPENQVKKDPAVLNIETSTNINEGVDKGARKKNDTSLISDSKISNNDSSAPHASRSICATCRPLNNSQEIRSVPSIMQSQELMKIRQQFQEATRRIQRTLSSLPSSDICGSKRYQAMLESRDLFLRKAENLRLILLQKWNEEMEPRSRVAREITVPSDVGTSTEQSVTIQDPNKKEEKTS